MKGGILLGKSQGYGGYDGLMSGPFIIFLILILLVLSGGFYGGYEKY